MYNVYILKSVNYKRIYIGISDDPERRLEEHNNCQTKSTKFYKPYKLVYLERYKDRRAARKREKYLKSGCGREWIKQYITGH